MDDEEQLEEQFFFYYHLHISRSDYMQMSEEERRWMIQRYVSQKEKEMEELQKARTKATPRRILPSDFSEN